MSRRGRTVLRVLALLLLAGAATSLLLTRRSDDAAAAAPAPSPSLRTPLWSPRRAPMLFVEAAAKARLTRDLSQAVAPFDACVAVDTADGTVARVGGERALAPASTTKLVTGVAALTVLGPDHRLSTRALLAPNGDLALVGGGDPLLATPPYIAHEHADARFRNAPYTELDALASQIAAGVAGPVNRIVVDDSRHDALRFLPEWKPNYASEGESGALGALTIDGGFTDAVLRTPAPDPAVLTGQRLAELLAVHGVTVRGGVARGTPPSDAKEIAHVDSAPIADVVGEMLRGSDNYTAELLMRELAVGAASGQPATTPMGIAVAMDTLTKLGIPHAGTDLHDGSGLAPGDRVSCPTLLAIVDRMHDPNLTALDRGLAIAGETGTLALRFGGDPLAGVLRAKTGSIDGVVGLAGTIDNATRPRFAFIANGNFSGAEGMALQSAVAHIVASYPQPVDVTALVPAP